jgi:hypothetical protein
VRIVIADSSPKFLRLAMEKFRHEERVAFRWVRYLADRKRLEFLDEVLEIPADALVSTNAIHLYYDLVDTLRSWARVLRPGHCAYVQSGNIRNPSAKPHEWIIDETVESLHEIAIRLVGSDPRGAPYRSIPQDPARMNAYSTLRRKFFLPVRPLEEYVRAFEEAGFSVSQTATETIEARVDQWYEFLAVYHEGVLGWIGGSERIEGHAPTERAVQDRLYFLRQAMDQLFEGREVFPCCWTYLTCRT